VRRTLYDSERALRVYSEADAAAAEVLAAVCRTDARLRRASDHFVMHADFGTSSLIASTDTVVLIGNDDGECRFSVALDRIAVVEVAGSLLLLHLHADPGKAGGQAGGGGAGRGAATRGQTTAVSRIQFRSPRGAARAAEIVEKVTVGFRR